MTKVYKPMEHSIIVGNRELSFDYKIVTVVEFSDRIVLLLNAFSAPPGDPINGRNILCYDKQGELLWQVQSTELSSNTYDPDDPTIQDFLSLEFLDGEIVASVADAVAKIRIEDGTLYDGEWKYR